MSFSKPAPLHFDPRDMARLQGASGEVFTTRLHTGMALRMALGRGPWRGSRGSRSPEGPMMMMMMMMMMMYYTPMMMLLKKNSEGGEGPYGGYDVHWC